MLSSVLRSETAIEVNIRFHDWFLVIDNAEFPADWFDRTSACVRDCENCGYCESVLSTVAGNLVTS